MTLGYVDKLSRPRAMTRPCATIAAVCIFTSLGGAARLVSDSWLRQPAVAAAKAEPCENAANTDLLQAAQQGEIAQVQALLACEQDPNELMLWRENFSPGSSDDSIDELLATHYTLRPGTATRM